MQGSGGQVDAQTGGSGASGAASVALETDFALLRDALEDVRR